MLRGTWLGSAVLLGTGSFVVGQGPALPPAHRQPVIPASVAPVPPLSRPLIAQPFLADPRYQPAPGPTPPPPGLLPPNYGQPFSPPAQPGAMQSQPPGQVQPPALAQPPTQGPTDWNPLEPNAQVVLPQKEKAIRLEATTVSARKYQDGWQVWAGPALLRDFGRNQTEAEEAVRFIRELRSTEWVAIGTGRPMLEYGLTNGRPHLPVFAPKAVVPIDLASVKAENVRGVWCLRDNASILVNFGRDKDDAEQAAAVVRRYGFNRLGVIGNSGQMNVLFAQPGLTPGRASGLPSGLGQLARISQEQTLTRTGIEVPGVGYVGERLVIDPKKLEVRKDRGEYVLAHGVDVLAKFGLSEWSARDALRVVQDMRATEFCRFNTEITFYLVNGQPPTRPPFSAQGTRFDTERLSLKPASAGQVGVYDQNGRLLYTVATKDEAEALVRLLRHYGFDQQCQLGLSGRNGLKFLAKVGR